MKFEGAWVALATPFRDGGVDHGALEEMVEFQISASIDGLVACGTTGEAPALSEEEHRAVAERVVRAAAGRVPVVVGTGTNNLDRTLSATRLAAELEAQGALIVTPYYNRPNQEGLFRYYSRIAADVDLPIILYNVPSRTGVNLHADTALRLSELTNVAAIKEASGDLSQIEAMLAGGLPVLSGDDALTFPILSLGGCGVISVVANLVPGEVAQMCRTFRVGDRETAQAIHRKLMPLCRALFVEANPIPLKAALRISGRGTGEVRLPLAPLSESNEGPLREAMRRAGLPVNG